MTTVYVVGQYSKFLVRRRISFFILIEFFVGLLVAGIAETFPITIQPVPKFLSCFAKQ